MLVNSLVIFEVDECMYIRALVYIGIRRWEWENEKRDTENDTTDKSAQKFAVFLIVDWCVQTKVFNAIWTAYLYLAYWQLLNDQFLPQKLTHMDSINSKLSFDAKILWLGLLFVLTFCQETSKKQQKNPDFWIIVDEVW